MQVTATNAGSAIIAAIPELRPDVEEWEGLDHLQFMELFLWTESSVESANVHNLHRAVRLVDAIFQDCDLAIKNAVTVSFLERIDPEDKIGKQIFDALTPALQSQWQALDGYMLQLIGKSRRGSVARSTGSGKS
jgi:hypothetical protein